jgi:levansucrase
MVADSVLGPYRPVNGSGLVAGAPDAEPSQSYSWWVCDDLSVVSFVDHWGMNGRILADDPGLNRSQFGGTPAPVFKLSLDGDCAKIVTNQDVT